MGKNAVSKAARIASRRYRWEHPLDYFTLVYPRTYGSLIPQAIGDILKTAARQSWVGKVSAVTVLPSAWKVLPWRWDGLPDLSTLEVSRVIGEAPGKTYSDHLLYRRQLEQYLEARREVRSRLSEKDRRGRNIVRGKDRKRLRREILELRQGILQTTLGELPL